MDKGKSQSFPPQHQPEQSGVESKMRPKPETEKPGYVPAVKLRGKVALITGGDSGIGNAVAILYAKEGANISMVYYNEHEDARKTKRQVERHGG